MPDAERNSQALSGRAGDAAPEGGRGAQEAALLLGAPAAAPRRDEGPIGRAEFARAFEPLQPQPPLAFAVSGGADSMALLLLGSAWARDAGLSPAAIIAVTVDHGLRPEAGAEAEQVARWAAARGHRHVTLRCPQAPTAGNMQAAARQARFGLLAQWCGAEGVRDVVLGHHREDQAETFLLHLARGSGVDGLSAMRPVSHRRAAGAAVPLRLLRPLLDFPKARLIATLQAAGQGWIEDPSNADPRFARARLRALATALGQEGLTPARLAGTAKRMARVRAALEAQTREVLGRSTHFDPAGFCRLDAAALRAAPEEIGLRVLAAILAAIGGGTYPPRLERTEALYRAILFDGLAGGRTLAGCQIGPGRGGSILALRETAAIGPPLDLRPGASGVWDGRFRVRLAPEAPCAGTVRALGDAGWRQIRPFRRAAGMPALARRALPSLWRDGEVLAVPALDCAREGFRPEFFTAEFPACEGVAAVA